MRLTSLGENKEKCVQTLLDAYNAKSTKNFVVHFLIHLLISVTTIFYTAGGYYEIFKKVTVVHRFGLHCNARVSLLLLCCLAGLSFLLLVFECPLIYPGLTH